MSLLERFIDEQNLHRTEGETGVKNLARIARALGYKDSTYFGAISANASYGDLINFFEDNSGAVEAVIEWIEKELDNSLDWQENLSSQLIEEEIEYEYGGES